MLRAEGGELLAFREGFPLDHTHRALQQVQSISVHRKITNTVTAVCLHAKGKKKSILWLNHTT